MSDLKCRCGNMTNTCVSEWESPQGPAEECYASFKDGEWVKGCSYNKTPHYMKQSVDSLIDRSKKHKLAFKFDAGD